MRARGRAALLAALSAACAALCGNAFAAGSSSAPALIVEKINESQLAPVGNVPLLAAPQFDRGAVSDSFPLEHMFVQLRRSAQQESELESLLTDQQDRGSASYHQWLTAAELGERFGPAQSDIDTVVQWLTSHGLRVNTIHQSGLTLDVSGNAGQVRETFHTEIHSYLVNGHTHISNNSVPQIPAALTGVVAGVVSLNDFLPRPALAKATPKSPFSFNCTGCPDGFNNTEQYDEAPPDFATIYNVTPLYKAKKPITGKGQTVAVLEVTDIKSSDVATFRKAFGLSGYSGTFKQIHPGGSAEGCTDPGTNGAEGEAALDSEWAGAIAPDADVELASCNNSAINFGAFIAAQNLLDSAKPPQVMSLSYLQCEANIGPGPNGEGYINALWQQAAAEGVSVFVAAGDGSAAGCDDFDTAIWAVSGIAANGLASTPYNVSTGGTDFLDTALNENSTYWSNSNSASGKSAKSYVPEMPWEDSCGSVVLALFYGYGNVLDFCNSSIGENFWNIVGGSGAPSFVFGKPYWQKNIPGNPSDGVRDEPDISLFASNAFWSHAILFCMSDASQGGYPCNYSNAVDTFNNSAGGTSFTAPQYASIQALINQKAGGAQGNPLPIYYDLYRNEFGSSGGSTLAGCNATHGNSTPSTCIFHDITVGSNTVPCYGTNDCYDPNAANDIGILSTSDKKLKPAYDATAGWDFTTGLGSVNVSNLVNAWP